MQFPYFYDVSRTREMTSVFGGYNHQLSCADGQFFDMKNMSSKYFPVLSPREKRGFIKTLVNPQGILDKEDLWWIDDRKLYKNGTQVWLTGVRLSELSPKTMAKMGAYLVIFPDKIYYNVDNGKCGYLDNVTDSNSIGATAEFDLCDEQGNAITYSKAEDYDKANAKDGDYVLSTSGAKPTLKVYSATTGIWTTVATTYISISFLGIGKGFAKDDCVKISVNDNRGLEAVFVNNEAEGIYSTDTYLVDVKDDVITIPGIYVPYSKAEGEEDRSVLARVERKAPSMSFITECNNRLWGCSDDGREVYCCRLGDVKNWRDYRGTSTGSWSATIGTDGKFTGAITYEGYPTFFKEDSILQIAVSGQGAHATRSTECRGLQEGSERSLAIIDKVIYYKSPWGVCTFNGGIPSVISDELGDERYSNAVAGAIDNQYYISMKNSKGISSLFVYDTKNGLWAKEDDTEALLFCKHNEELYFVDAKDKMLKSARGTLEFSFPEAAKEEEVSWYVESGNIGYSSPDYKYIARINIRITLETGSNADFYVQYDSNGIWEHKFNMNGVGTRSFSIPIIPRRCDHFSYKISGKGGCKIHSLTKTVEEGSDD